MAEQVYRYKAFISYRHTERDRIWARWLIEGLETFRTPRSLLARGVPSHIGHLFRDDDEIPASSNLSSQIEEALKASQFLIVVCSPNTPQSAWVSHEIDYFRKLGRGDRILALLIEGEPSESFPPELLHVPYEKILPDGTKTIELRDEEPIAADIRPRTDEPKHQTERRALLRVSATLLGCSFDDLAQRDHRRAVHRQRIIGSAIAAVLLVVIAGGAWWWDYTRLKTGYFADAGTHWGEPFGIGKISEDDASHRYASYMIQTRRGHVVAMRRVNGSGGLRALKGDEIDADPWNSGVSEWRLSYQDNHVGSIELYSPTGRLLRTESYRFFPDGQTGLVSFTQARGSATALSSRVTSFQTRLGATLSERHPDVTQHRLTFTPDGLVARRVFETVWGTPGKDENGSTGRAYQYTPAGQVASVRNLDARGNILISRTGVAEERRSYTTRNELTLFELRDRLGAPLSSIVAHYDGWGNRVERIWIGFDGKPQRNDQDGVARETDEFDSHGNILRARFFDETFRPVLGNNGFAQLAFAYDARGNVVRTIYLDVLGRPVVSKFGFAGVTVQLDAAGNTTGLHMFGTDGRPQMGVDGYAGQSILFDANGNPVDAIWLGLDGKPHAKLDGVAMVRGRYDGNGNAVEEHYLNAAGHPVAGEDGYATVRRKFDDRGDETEEAYFGPDGRPVMGKQGYARQTTSYTDAGAWAQADYFGTDGQPVLNVLGVARVVYGYDDRGNANQETFFGTAGQRVVGINGYSRLLQVYDAFDNVVEQHYFDASDKPVLVIDHYASVRDRFDDRGNTIDEQFFDVDGKPILTTKGYARAVMAYNSHNQLVEQRHYDTAGKLTGGPSGVAIIRWRFDALGRQTVFATYGADGQLIMNALGYAMGRDAFDAHGDRTESAYFGADGKLIVSSNGYAVMRNAYEAHGLVTDQAFFGADGKPMMHGKYAHAHIRYNAAGTAVGVALFDAQGKPIRR